MSKVLNWQPAHKMPNKDDHVIVKFYNDLGMYHAAGLFYLTRDTNEPVFCDVLAGHIYDWKQTVVAWARL